MFEKEEKGRTSHFSRQPGRGSFGRSKVRLALAATELVAFYEDLEYELFDWALGDNPQEKKTISVPKLRGLALPLLFKLSRLLEEFHFVTRLRAYDEPIPEDPMGGAARTRVFPFRKT